ncbi:Rv1733c family protein [Streptomyces jeddahensis]|uniref:Uncharacterized protein n=1 Tax=Streptomyces jeddahensis TaxID=1716141 RepID=A0A177HHU9_9ACTN|nr:hypothetical protein [Streptomyces jeddahensis]OAH09758.1 hypothetical protein STSP_69310 [Streptomyces jeddahensis]
MRAIAGFWRWRHNPLRRRTDLVEAWVALAAALLIAVAVPVVGVVIGDLSRHALLQSVKEQQRERHRISATVVKVVAQPRLDPDPETAPDRDSQSRVIAEWTAPDGTAHRGTVMADLKEPHAGDRFALWTDAHGAVVGRPLDTTTATTHAVLAGFGAAAAAAALVEGGRRLIVWRMVLRRYARWDRAWEKTGPDWGRTGTGS